MRDEDRIAEVIGALTIAWYKHPDLRLGQLVTNAPYFEADGTNTGYAPPAFAVEDDVMLAGLRGIARND